MGPGSIEPFRSPIGSGVSTMAIVVTSVITGVFGGSGCFGLVGVPPVGSLSTSMSIVGCSGS